MNRIIFIGHIGSDAGGWYITPDGKIHKIPGWAPDQLREVTNLMQGLRSVSQLRSPGVAEKVAGALMDAVKTELGSHMREGDVLVLG